MFRKSKSNALMERDAVSRAVAVAGQAGERAATAARDARRAAAPVVRRSAHTAAGALSDAAEKAAEVFADTADKLASADQTFAARERLADRAEQLAAAVRPKKRHHRIRKLLLISAIGGGIVALVKSPLKTKLANRLFGEPATDEDIEAITLPVDEAPDGEATGTPVEKTTASNNGGHAPAKHPKGEHSHES